MSSTQMEMGLGILLVTQVLLKEWGHQFNPLRPMARVAERRQQEVWRHRQSKPAPPLTREGALKTDVRSSSAQVGRQSGHGNVAPHFQKPASKTPEIGVQGHWRHHASVEPHGVTDGHRFLYGKGGEMSQELL